MRLAETPLKIGKIWPQKRDGGVYEAHNIVTEIPIQQQPKERDRQDKGLELNDPSVSIAMRTLYSYSYSWSAIVRPFWDYI